MKAKQKAEELANKFKDHVNPYLGSGMLSNDISEYAILMQSKSCALIAVKELVNHAPELSHMEYGSRSYWQQVEIEIKNHKL